MADAPSWLTEEDTVETPNPATKNSSTSSSNKKAAATAVAAVASNPKAQKYAAAAAADKGSKWISGDDDEPVTKPKDVEKGKVDRDEPEDFEMDPAELKDMQKYHLILRVAYILAAIIMGVTAGVSLINQTDLGKIFFAFYVMFFVSLICCFECGLNAIARYIAVNFGFMYTLGGRWIFILFVGFMSFSLTIYGKISMGILYAVGIFHVYVLYKFPRLEEYLRKKHYSQGNKKSSKG